VLTYAIVLLVVAAVLYGSFRALGGGAEPVPADDYRQLLRRIAQYTSERVVELDAALSRQRPAPSPTLRPDADPLEVLGSARALLTAAIEDQSWACRLLEGGSYRENPGIQDAVAALRDHSARCMEAAASVLAGGVTAPA